MLRVSAVCGLLLLLPGGPAGAADVTLEKIPDAPLVDQRGAGVRFLSEAIGDKLAAVTFTFTSCHTICPRLDGIFAGLQSRLGEHLGEDTVLLTLSVDPANDVPERLKTHAEKLRARPGWRFLTGDQQEVISLLKALEVFSPNIYDHPPTVFVVDGRRDAWTRLSGFPSPDTIASVIEQYRKQRDGR